MKQARKRQLLSAQHFTGDGTLYQPGGSNGYTPSNPDVDFKGQRRSNETHYSPIDQEALMSPQGQGQRDAIMCFWLCPDGGRYELGWMWSSPGRPAQVSGRRRTRCTPGADKGYDVQDFITSCQELPVSPHIARKESFWGSAVLAKLAPTPGDQASQRKRKRVEEIFGCTKTVAGGRKLRYKGVERN